MVVISGMCIGEIFEVIETPMQMVSGVADRSGMGEFNNFLFLRKLTNFRTFIAAAHHAFGVV